MSVTQQQLTKHVLAKADREERLVAALEGMLDAYVRLARYHAYHMRIPEVIAAEAVLSS